MLRFLIPVLFLLLLLASPVLLPLVFMLVKRETDRKATDAGKAVCLICEHLLGPGAIHRADLAFAAYAKAAFAHAADNGYILRMTRHVDAICPNCEARYSHDSETRSFTLVHPDAH